MKSKQCVSELAICGGDRLFERPRSTSNLLRPEFQRFLDYSKAFFERHQYTNNGPNVRLLEERLAEFHGTAHCITFSSGFWALAVAITVLALEGKTEIVMPSLTYRRMNDIAAWVKLKPHFCEVDPATLAMSSATVDPCINQNTAVILGVHPIVNCCDVQGLVTLARRKNIPLLFDSVESAYESTPSGRVGGFGDAEGFSLHACKLINGFGGGYITTNDSSLAKQLALRRGFGFEDNDNIITARGLNAKLNDVHAAMALASLDTVEEQVQHNRMRYEVYRQLLGSIPGIRLLEFDADIRSGYKNIVVELLDEWPLSRSGTLAVLNEENILARAYYPQPLHRKPMRYPYVSAELPLTDSLAERFMNLPCGHLVSVEDIAHIVDMLSFIRNNADSIAVRLHAFTSGAQ